MTTYTLQNGSVLMVVVLAGRRPDPEGRDDARFPLSAAGAVRLRLRTLWAELRPERLVCSAACGADLLALDEAGRLGIKRTVVLPFSVKAFRRTSVTDRPGDWGPLYDRTVREVDQAGGLLILDCAEGDAAFAAVTDRLVKEAFRAGRDVVAVAVWEGRGADDGETGRLIDLAMEQGGRVREVSTLLA